ncbi:MAG: protein-S-isoprenylcysteine O-methyltransferase [Bacteroidota bacterium]
MNPLILKIVYMAFWVAIPIIRYPFAQRQKANQISVDRKSRAEKTLLYTVPVGTMLFPLLYVFTSLLSLADYVPPRWVPILGMILTVPTLWLFYRSHKDLGLNWSVSLEIREGHTLVDGGVYRYIRHPMYSALWLFGVVQACLLPNWIAGPSGLVTFGLLYFFRVGKEETMMQQQLGEQYTAYMRRTKRLIPFVI